MTARFTRRRLLGGAAGLALAAAAGVELGDLLSSPDAGAAPLGAAPAGLPERQHAWEAFSTHDAHGNIQAPRHDRLLLFDLTRTPHAADGTRMEAALRAIERAHAWAPHGLLFTVGWGPAYFERIGAQSPVPKPEAMSDFELPTLDRYATCIHLASNDDARLDEVVRTLDEQLPSALTRRELRTGFTGAGLPASKQDVGGIPSGHPVPKASPLYMGFKSGYRKNQASEDDVTIRSGPFAGGTTMHVSRMRLRLDSWYALDERDRVGRMFAPQVTPADVSRFTSDAPAHPGQLTQAATRYGVVGHSQTSARARRNGRPVILRRDFDTTDGGEAGLHFVCLQRSIADFVATRKAMNASRASYLNPQITSTDNNGINEFIFVTHRANYVIPPRRLRSFPLV